MQATVKEGHAPAIIIALQPGETITSEAGAMMFISGEIETDVQMPGGLVNSLKRTMFAGESLFLATYTARGPGAVGLTGPFPGSIRQVELDGELICEKHAYLAHHGEIAIEPVLAASAGMGLKGGGEGFVLQKLSGRGTAWIHGGGDFVDFDLVPGQILQVDTGCMVAIEPSVQYEVKRRGSVKEAAFGGEGLHVVQMTGPGHVTLQTLPFSRTAKRVREAAGGGQGERSGGGGGLLGKVLGEG
jgi:uncharacterized protein (TIGR00266 family)